MIGESNALYLSPFLSLLFFFFLSPRFPIDADPRQPIKMLITFLFLCSPPMFLRP